MMPGSLDPTTATRLAKICGLLGSDQDGERSAAAWQATKLLRSQGLTWTDVFTPALPPPSRPQPRPAYQHPTYHTPVAVHVAKAEWAQRFPDRLTPWEAKFLADLRLRRSLTPKQASVLDGILAKMPRAGAA